MPLVPLLPYKFVRQSCRYSYRHQITNSKGGPISVIMISVRIVTKTHQLIKTILRERQIYKHAEIERSLFLEK
jgi:hypothetical protein